MADLLGMTALLAGALITLGLAARHPSIRVVLLVAFAARAAAALFHFYVAPLPDGTSDAVSFERYAWEWSQGGLVAALEHFPGLDAYFYAWLMSLLYAVTDRSLLMLQAVNVLVGVLGVFVAWKLASELWGGRAGRKVAWVMALFPLVVQYGAIPMREAGFMLFLLLALLAVVRWQRHGGVVYLAGVFAGFLAAAFFHGGAVVGLLAFLGLVGWRSARQWAAGLSRGRLRWVATLTVFLVLGLLGGYVVSGVSIHKLGTAEEIVSTERWMHYFESRVYGGARYPGWTQPQGAADFVWAVPLRAVYLLFAPFPWDLREPAHVVGLVDGLLYLALAFLVWRNRQAIRAIPEARTLFLILVPLVFAYGVGTGNFGTALRHRTKLVAAVIVLAAPRLPRLVWRLRKVSVRDTPVTPQCGGRRAFCLQDPSIARDTSNRKKNRP